MLTMTTLKSFTNSVWDRCSLWHLPGQSVDPLWRQREQWLWPSQSKPFWPSLSTCPRLPPFSLLWRGGLLCLALLYATTSLLAEWHYAIAWNASPSFAVAEYHTRLADALFPLEYRIRNSVGYLYTAGDRKNVSIDKAISGVQTAIKYNPYAADLHADLLKLYAEKKDVAGTRRELETLIQLAPNSDVVQTLLKAGLK
jgi:hypothetical protein